MLKEQRSTFRTSFVRLILRNIRKFDCSGYSRPYLNIGHTGLNDVGFRQWLSDTGVAPIYFVHDLIPITHPNFCRRGEADRHRERMRTVLTTASGIIGNSQATLDDLHHFARKEGLPTPPGIAVWLGVPRLRPPPLQNSNQGQPTFVSVGTIEARKNHLLLLKLWTRFIDRLKEKAPRLLIVGRRGWEADEVFTLLDREKHLNGHVVEMNGCTDEELARHLSSARALLFPSYAEGFGLPLVEALDLGVPVIASDLPVFREIGQGVPTFVGPTDEAAWETAVLDFARENSAERAAQLERVQQFRSPSWDVHFSKVERWLEGLAL